MSENVGCITDKIFEMTASINNYFATNVTQKHIFMIICGGMMDVMVITTFCRFCFYGTSWRLILALIVFYGFRAIMQKLFFICYPEGYLWDFPGFYSLTVPYGRTNDFFYSGHVGCCVICGMEALAIGWKKFGYFFCGTTMLL